MYCQVLINDHIEENTEMKNFWFFSGNFKNELQSADVRRRVLEFTSSKHKIDLSKKPGDSVPQASFRKLTVD